MLVNMLIFDELINYLDIVLCEILEEVIWVFSGIIIIVLYDCYFID